MSLLRIDCPACGSRYAFQDERRSGGRPFLAVSCVGEDCLHWVRAALDEPYRLPAARRAIEKYTTPVGRMKVVAREGETG